MDAFRIDRLRKALALLAQLDELMEAEYVSGFNALEEGATEADAMDEAVDDLPEGDLFSRRFAGAITVACGSVHRELEKEEAKLTSPKG